MKRIVPYKSTQGAMAALDNGGRFYNLFTRSDDGKIAPAELARVAGAFTSRQKMFLFLEMALAELDGHAADAVRAAMSTELRAAHRAYRPALYTPAQALARGRAAQPAIVTGVPHYVKSRSDFAGFIMVPISTGKSTTFIMVPLIDHYDVYEVHDTACARKFIIAHARGTTRLTRRLTRFGGILKKLHKAKSARSGSRLYLEALFYSPA